MELVGRVKGEHIYLFLLLFFEVGALREERVEISVMLHYVTKSRTRNDDVAFCKHKVSHPKC